MTVLVAISLQKPFILAQCFWPYSERMQPFRVVSTKTHTSATIMPLSLPFGVGFLSCYRLMIVQRCNPSSHVRFGTSATGPCPNIMYCSYSKHQKRGEIRVMQRKPFVIVCFYQTIQFIYDIKELSSGPAHLHACGLP